MALMSAYVKEKEIYGYETLFRTLGSYICRLEQYERSLQFFDEAIKKTPEDVRALRGRSIARAKSCLYQGALEDINKALALDPGNLQILADKALNTYLSCEFEEGLIQNTRLLPIRQKPDCFALGVMHCSDAIESCVGERSGRPLRDHFLIIRKLAWKKYMEDEKSKSMDVIVKRKKKKKTARILQLEEELYIKKAKKADESGIRESLRSYKCEKDVIPPYTEIFPFRPLQRHTTNIKNYMAERYLDSMYLDKIFLDELHKKPGAISPNHKGSEKILQLAKGAYKEVSYKQELLRTRKPFYFIKFQEVTPKGALKARKEAELLMAQQNSTKEATNILDRIIAAYNDKKLSTLLCEAERLREYCDSKPKRLFPDKDKFKKEVFEYICNGYYGINRINEKQYNWDQEKRIYVSLGLPVSKEPSTDSVIKDLKPAIFDYKRRMLEFTERLKRAEEANETCWCFYELCKCGIMMKNWDVAKVYAKQCINLGKKSENSKWVVNAHMLLAKISVSQQNSEDAQNEINEALKVATELNDKVLQKYLERCIEVVHKIEFSDIYGPQIIEKRQNKIISMMGNVKMKDELSYIFRTMAAMPASRRMNIIPGVKPEDDTEKKTGGGRKMTIQPGGRKKTDTEDSHPPVRKSKGVGFISVVEEY